jgi:TatD DNase family protein
MLIDTHCHLHLLDNYPDELDKILEKNKAHGVTHLLNVAVKLEDTPTQYKIAELDNTYISIGIHPNESPGKTYDSDDIEKAAYHPKCIALGETGLDYYRQDSEDDLTWQQMRFVQHIDLCKKLKKPMIIHSRHAKKDTINIMREHNARDVGGVMHCFTEDWEMAKQAMDLGFYISFSGIVTFKNAKQIQEVAIKMPLDRMFLETDCPYLTPEPYRGKPNCPAYTKYVAEGVAKLRNESFEKICEQTSKNFFELFDL